MTHPFRHLLPLLIVLGVVLSACTSSLIAPPAEVRAAAGGDYVEVTWTAPGEGETGFRVYREVVGLALHPEATPVLKPLATLGPEARNFLDRDVDTLHRYRYGVSALRGGVESAVVVQAGEPVRPEGEGPLAKDDAFSVTEGETLEGNLLADNGAGADTDPDSGPDGDPEDFPLKVVAVNGDSSKVGAPQPLASGATLAVKANGDFSYFQNSAFEWLAAGTGGDDTFTYTIADRDGERGAAVVTVTVRGLNDPPLALPVPPQTLPSDPIDLNGFFVDIDEGDALRFALIGTLPGWLGLEAGSKLVAVAPKVSEIGGVALVEVVATDPSGATASADVSVALGCPSAAALHVDATAGGNATGLSWPDAFVTVQDALSWARACPGVAEVRIAEGVYYPDEGEGQIDDDRASSFILVEGVTVQGGFPTGGATAPDPGVYLTVLSGDVDHEIAPDRSPVARTPDDIRGSNAYHVVTADGFSERAITAATVLRGLTVTAGQATGDGSTAGDGFLTNAGGGFLCDGDGRLGVGRCEPSLIEVVFRGNLASNEGGAMMNFGESNGVSSPILTDVSFIGNRAEAVGNAVSRGGAIFNAAAFDGESSPTLVNVSFLGNEALSGGALYNDSDSGGVSSPRLINVVFSGNRAVSGSTSTARRRGGALYNRAATGVSSPSLTNVTFSRNEAAEGGAIYSVGPSAISLINVILWGNAASLAGDQIFTLDTTVTLRHTLVQNEIPVDTNDGGNNLIDENPLFVDDDGGDGVAGTPDDDLRLRRGSPAIDAGASAEVEVGTDLDGKARIVGVAVDLGAYERP